jgi:hypothetical protein
MVTESTNRKSEEAAQQLNEETTHQRHLDTARR